MTVSITVAIPTHNRRETLLMAIESVMLQSRAPAQVIVICDGCTDGSPEAVRALGDDRVEVLEMPKGPRLGWGNRNEALRRASSDVIAWLSDDDLWFSDHLARVGAIFDAGAADLVQANTCVVHPDGRLEMSNIDWRVDAYRERYLADVERRTPMSAVSHLRDLAAKAGGWNPDPPDSGDTDLWKRILRLEPRTVALVEPTVLFFQAWREAGPARTEQARSMLATLRDSQATTRLRVELSYIQHKFEADTRHELYTRNDQHAALHEEYGAALETMARLRERDATLTRIESGGWWRLRGRLLPVIRAAQAVRRVARRRSG